MGFSLNGRHSNELGLITRLTRYGLHPTFTQDSLSVPGQVRTLLVPRKYTPRILEFQCSFRPNPALWSKRFHEVSEWLDVTDGRLILDQAPDRYYTVSLAGSVDLDALYRQSAAFTVRFMATDPYAYSISAKELLSQASVSLNRVYLLAATKTETTPVIRLRAEVQQKLRLVFSASELVLSGPIGAEPELVIDCGKQTATYGGGSALKYLNPPVFPQLKKKETLKLLGDGRILSLTIRAHERWRC